MQSAQGRQQWEQEWHGGCCSESGSPDRTVTKLKGEMISPCLTLTVLLPKLCRVGRAQLPPLSHPRAARVIESLCRARAWQASMESGVSQSLVSLLFTHCGSTAE